MSANNIDPVKRAQWQKHLTDWRSSGLTIRKFCLDHGLETHRFYYYRSVFEEKPKKSRFIPVDIIDEDHADQIESSHKISLFALGGSIDFEGAFSPEFIAEVFKRILA